MTAILIAKCRRCGRFDIECDDGPSEEHALCQSCQGLSISALWPVIPPADEVDRALARVRQIRRRYPNR